MIGKLKGIADSIFIDHAIIDTGGVGYMVFCSKRVLDNLQEGQPAELLIETHVREDHIHLYGFAGAEEKNAFLILQSVKGVGTRMSLAILSHFSPPEIQNALLKKDTGAFTAISGVGKKLAERIITELKDRVLSTGDVSSFTSSNSSRIIEDELTSDAISALMSLGINKGDAANRVSRIIANNENIKINELIKLALQNGNS